jgi:hypothetical protein
LEELNDYNWYDSSSGKNSHEQIIAYCEEEYPDKEERDYDSYSDCLKNIC